MVRTRSRTLSEISRSTLKKGERVKSSQVKKIKKSKLNKQMQKSRNGNGKALVLSLFWKVLVKACSVSVK